MRKQGKYSSCELPGKQGGRPVSRNRHYRFQENFRWKGVRVEQYKPEGDDWSGIVRQSLIGAGGESTRFHLRYFEIAPDGFSSFERHRHEHVVIGARGRGKAKVGRKIININFMDVLYIRSNEPHRLYNPFKDPFGFFCIVNAKRDRPKLIKS